MLKKCVLIYDDDSEMLFLCKTILATATAYQVETLSRCENIITDVERLHPDIILMDLWIPTIGGEAAVTELKANPGTKHIPVLLFSANADIKEISKKIQADGFIEKPFDISDFKEMIERYIS